MPADVETLLRRLADLEALIAQAGVGRDGRDGRPGIPGRPGLDARGLPGKNGRDGKDGRDGVDGLQGIAGADGTSVTLDDVRPLIDEAVAARPLAKSITVDDMRPIVADLVDAAMARMPTAREGPPGPRGVPGPRGPEGPEGPIGPMPDHRWEGTWLQFLKPDGEWGKLVNLQGPRGARGGGGGGGGSMVTIPAPPAPAPAPAPSSGETVPGAPTFVDFPAAVALGGHRAVRLLAGEVVYADNAVIDDANVVLGITQGAVGAGGVARIQTGGLMTEPSWTWTPDEPVFVGSNGLLVQPSPASGFSLIVGIAMSATQILIGARTPLVLL